MSGFIICGKRFFNTKTEWKYCSVINIQDISGADPEILKRGGALCQPPWLAVEENFRF